MASCGSVDQSSSDNQIEEQYLSIDEDVKAQNNEITDITITKALKENGLFKFIALKGQQWEFFPCENSTTNLCAHRCKDLKCNNELDIIESTEIFKNNSEGAAQYQERCAKSDQTLMSDNLLDKSTLPRYPAWDENIFLRQQSSTSFTSFRPGPPQLPDLLSTSSSETHFSLVEDIANRHESSLNGSCCTSINTMEGEDVFEEKPVLPGNSDQYKNETEQSLGAETEFIQPKDDDVHLVYARSGVPDCNTQEIQNTDVGLTETECLSDSETEVKEFDYRKGLALRPITTLCNDNSHSSSIELDRCGIDDCDRTVQFVDLKKITHNNNYGYDDNSEVHKQFAYSSVINRTNTGKANNILTKNSEHNNRSDSSETELMELSFLEFTCDNSTVSTTSIMPSIPHDTFCLQQLKHLETNNIAKQNINFQKTPNSTTWTDQKSEIKKKYKKLVEENVIKDLQNGKDVNEILNYIEEQLNEDNDLETDGGNSSTDPDENQQNCEKEHGVTCLSTFGLITTDQEEMVRQLAMAKQCDGNNCEEVACRQGKHILARLKEKNLDEGFFLLVLAAIASHSRDCTEIKCPVAYCTFCNENCDDVQSIADLVVLFKNEFHSLIPKVNIAKEHDYYNLEDDGYHSLPEQGVNYNLFYRREENCFFGQLETSSNHSKYIIIKKSRWFTTDYEMLKTVKEIQSVKTDQIPKLVNHLWACRPIHTKDLYLALEFEESWTLREYLKCFHPDGLPMNDLVQRVTCLCNAMEFLHKNQILYLNWLAEHVIVGKSLKLCNIGASTTNYDIYEDGDMEDLVEDMMAKLPPFIIPPEFYENKVAFPASDYWGLGCLIYELASGNHVHWAKRHMSYMEQRDQIRKDPIPDLTLIKQHHIKTMLQQCFKKSSIERSCIFT